MSDLDKTYGNYIAISGPLTQNAFDAASDELPTWVCKVSEKHFGGPVTSSGHEKAVVLVYDWENQSQIYSVVPGNIIAGVFRARNCTTLTSYKTHEDLVVLPDAAELELPINDTGAIAIDVVRYFESLENNAVYLPSWLGNPEPLRHEKASFDKDTALSAKRVDHLLIDLLKSNNGVFLGERHDHSNIKEAVTHLMSRLKAEGVTTISYECHNSTIENLQDCKSREEALRTVPIYPARYVESLYDMVQAAKRCGVTVIGHEKPTAIDTEIHRIGGPEWWAPGIHKDAESLKDKYEKEIAAATSLDGLSKRDEWAASFIRENAASGKFIVIGGAAHSTHSGIDAENKYLGLNKRLGIPSIDTVYGSSVSIEQFAAIPEGYAVSNAASGADFCMNIPPDVFERMRQSVRPGYYNGTTWPPPSVKEMSAVWESEAQKKSAVLRINDIDWEAIKRAAGFVNGGNDVTIDPNSGNHAQDQSSAGVPNGQASQNSVNSR